MIKHLLVCFFVTVNLTQYTLVKTFQNLSPQVIYDATVSTTGEFLYVKTNTTYDIYTSTYNLYQSGTGMYNVKFEVSDNIFTTGHYIWGRKTHDFEMILNLSTMIFSRVSKNDLVVIGFSLIHKSISVWSRPSLSDSFAPNSTIPINDTVLDATINFDGSLLAVATITRLYFYKCTQGIYKIYDMFMHSLSYSFLYPQVLTFDNFNIVLARDNNQIKCFKLVDSAYQLYKNISYPNMQDWSIDTDHLIVKQDENVWVLKRNGIDFVEVQNLATTATAVGAKNGTLITANGTIIMVWKSIKSGLNQDEVVQS